MGPRLLPPDPLVPAASQLDPPIALKGYERQREHAEGQARVDHQVLDGGRLPPERVEHGATAGVGQRPAFA